MDDQKKQRSGAQEGVLDEKIRNMYYKLDENKNPVPCDLKEWGEMFEKDTRRVAHDTVGKVRISTIFLGIDHNWHSDGPPQFFETMIFNGEHDQWQERCATWKEAEAQHAYALHLVKSGRLHSEKVK